MSALSRKVCRDIAAHRGRSALVVLAVAAGIASFTAVLASDAILRRALNEGYRATNPASAVLRVDGADGALLAALRADPEIAAAEARRVVRGRIRGPAGWRGLVLFASEDWPNAGIARITPETGSWPPADGEILVERDAFSVAGAAVGDTVLVRSGRGDAIPVRIAGRVHDVGQAQARMENIVYAYATPRTLDRLGEAGDADRIEIVARAASDEGRIRAAAQRARRIAEDLGHAVSGVDVPKPGEHPHAAVMGMLMRVIGGFGIAALVLSGVLVVNLTTAILEAQVRAVGIMQAIGGTRARIASIYLRQALLLGGAAVAIGVPAGMFGARPICAAMARFLNFDVVDRSVPLRVLALAVAVGLILPLAAAAGPVWRGCRVTVREALSDFGVSGDGFGTSAFDRWIGGIGGAARPVLLAVRNGFRRRTRLLLTAAVLAAGGVFFMAAHNVRASLTRTLDRSFERRKYDLSVSLAGIAPGDAIARAVARVDGIARAEGWIATEGAIAGGGSGPAAGETRPSAAAVHGGSSMHGARDGVAGDRFLLLAIPPGTPLLDMEIVAGRALRPGDTDAIVANTALAAKDPRFRAGGTVTLALGPDERPWRVVGIAREPFAPPAGYLPKTFFDAFHPGGANALRVALRRGDGASTARVRDDLEQKLGAEGVRVASTVSRAESRFGFDQHMVMIDVFLVLVSGLLGAVGGLGLATTMSVNVLERRRELGVLRALGATPGLVAGMLAAESAAAGILSWALAAAAAWPVSRAIGDLVARSAFRTRLDFAFAPAGAAIWLAVCLMLGAAASVGPAWRASRAPVREALDEA